MPICNKIPFRRRKPDASIKDDDRVWYHDLTQEVFTTYDDFFDRYIKCNSVCWTCSLTGKSNLTFEDALKSEKKAIDEIKASFPRQLAQPLLWYSQHCYRGKIDDLLNDIYCVSRDRYFIGELVWYQKTDTVRHKGTIQAVEYDPTKGLKISPKKKEKRVSDDEDEAPDAPKKKTDKLKPEEPEMPPPEAYTYTFLIFGENEDNENAIFTDIPHTKISRPKAVGSRVKLKHYFKNLMMLKGDRIVVKPKVIQEFELNKLNLTDFFAGPLPKFAHVPRKRLFGPTSEVKIPSAFAKRKLDTSSDVPQKKKRLSKAEKFQKEILEQQETLQEVFEQAETFEVEDLSKWRQTDRLLTDKEIEELKDAIKEAREDYRERERDRKKKERDEQMAQKKPRDDLQCDDLRPLPEFKPVELPEFISDDMFGEMLALFQFFNTFRDLLENEEIEITFQDCVEAVLSKKPSDNGLVKILTAFLKIRAVCVDKEDGDEANPEAPSEVSNETYAIFSNKTYGRTIISLNKLYEKIRFIFAANPPTLPINWMSISEVLRLNLITSGYCSIGTVYARRATERGGIDCYEDPVFMHLSSDQHIPEKLETASIFSLTPEERLTLFEILREQMLTFATLRNPQEERLLFVPDAKRQLKHLKLWDIEQDKAAKIAGYTSEDNDKKNTKDKKVVMLKNYLKAVNEQKRKKIPDLEEIKEIMLSGIPYDDFDAEDIRELREIQKTFVNEKIEKLNRDIFEGFCKIGLPFLGRDRAFRLYYYFDVLKVFLIENVMDPGDCEEPTPMKDVETKDLTKARIEVTGCTGDKTNCPVHNTNRPRWLYLAEKDGIDLLMDAMNPRGFREIDLVETLSSFKPFIGPIVDDLADQMARYAIQDKENDEKPMEVDEAEKIEKGAAEETEDSPIPVENGLPKLSPEHESSTAPEADDETASNTSSTRVTRSSSRTNVVKVAKVKKEKSKPCVKNIIAFLGLDDVKMEEVGDENELKEAMKILLLEMEENIQVKAIGEMLLNADQTREDFRKAVSDGADIKPFLVKDVDYFAHCAEEVELLSDEQLEDFTTELHQLILAFVKIIHSVRMKFLEESPFMMVPKKSKTNEVVAAPTFIEWQRQLLECKSISSLAVFYEIFNERVSWHYAKTGKCYSCRKKAVIEESVVCEICSAMYHLNCAPTKVTSRVYYLCSKSCEKKAAKAAEKKNEKIAQIAVKSVVKVEKDKSVDETKPTVEEMDEDADADNNSSVENHSDEIKPRRRRNANKKPVDYSELENGGKSDSEEPRTRRSNRTRTKKEPGFDDECNFRAISMGLRNGTKVETDLKKQLVECQKVIENAMKQEFGYPFSHPVNEKDAPGYAEAIKKPMDLRTMINKFKNLDYESTVQVWKDCKLIVDNCKAYNYEDDEIIGDADELYEYLKKEFRSIIGDVVDVE